MDVMRQYFQSPKNVFHKQYEALRSFYLEKKPASEVAKKFGYTLSTLYSLTRDFKQDLLNGRTNQRFFVSPIMGRKPKHHHKDVRTLIIELRKKYLSVPDIKSILDSQNEPVSETYIYHTLHREGFARLPRRNKHIRKTPMLTNMLAAQSTVLKGNNETFNTTQAGLLCFLLYIKAYDIDNLIAESSYPETQTLPKLNSILSFIALKLSNIRRYTSDDLWCMDRGSGLFAGLNVLPKAAWFTSYSHRITRDMNLDFLRRMNQLWVEKGLLSDTANLDFVAIPYWGEDSHLENNWSGTRKQALSSILAAVAHDPDSGIITYGDTNVRHNSESHVVVEFLDFYKQSGDTDLRYLIFDSKFTTYENLSKLDDNHVKFITIRRRGKKIVAELDNSSPEWKTVRVKMANGKGRQLKVNDKQMFLKGYNKKIRQLAIMGHGRIKPALIITNDFDISKEEVIRKYARRWLVEKTISEQTHFFHLNKVSSSMVIKVDFDLTMTILAYNLYRLLASDLEGYNHNTAITLYEKFIQNAGKVELTEDEVTVFMKKKRHLPALLSLIKHFSNTKLPWLGNKKLNIVAASYS